MKFVVNKETRTARWGEVFYWRGRSPAGRRLFGSHRVGWLHGDKNGAPVLRGKSSWRTIVGFYANVGGGFFTIQFRRFLWSHK
jgi:hypothetical protein